MATPRCVLPDQTLLVTRRTYQRTFRLRPHRTTNQSLRYALGYAASKTGVLLHGICVMSNHLHLLASDPRGVFPEFLREFHRLAAKVLNASQAQWENLWAAEKCNVLPLADDHAMLDRMAYIVANPVAAGLVRRPEEWPGVLHWRPGSMKIPRPTAYFDPSGPCPAVVELAFVRPPRPAWTEAEWEERLEKAIESRVARAHEQRKRTGQRCVGRAAVLAASFLRRAASYERKREPLPRVAATEVRAKRWLLFVRERFLVEYRAALKEWCAGMREAVFPSGTWWMRVFHGAAVAAPVPAAA